MSASNSRGAGKAGRPYVICHMTPSVDGRIVIDAWRLPRSLSGEYERTASSFDADAWIIGRSFLAAGLVDELSLLVTPVADGGVGTPTLFDAREGPGPARPLKLLSVERRRDDLLWLRYEVRRGRR